jgi:hypothetical protein
MFAVPAQGLDYTCGFYAAHNLMLAMGHANLDDPQVRLQIYIIDE